MDSTTVVRGTPTQVDLQRRGVRDHAARGRCVDAPGTAVNAAASRPPVRDSAVATVAADRTEEPVRERSRLLDVRAHGRPVQTYFGRAFCTTSETEPVPASGVRVTAVADLDGLGADPRERTDRPGRLPRHEGGLPTSFAPSTYAETVPVGTNGPPEVTETDTWVVSFLTFSVPGLAVTGTVAASATLMPTSSGLWSEAANGWLPSNSWVTL